jgi:hypothetical protein
MKKVMGEVLEREREGAFYSPHCNAVGMEAGATIAGGEIQVFHIAHPLL